MIFEKPSTRTRMSFDIAVKQLGGSSIILNPEGIHYGKGNESLKDTAKVLTEYVDIVMLRTSSHKNLEEFGKYLDIPIINGLSDISHPCQIMSDILTYEESNGLITGKTICWLGDGNNNMSNSLIEAAGKFNFNLKIGFGCSKYCIKVSTMTSDHSLFLILMTSSRWLLNEICLLYTSPSPRDLSTSRMPSSA